MHELKHMKSFMLYLCVLVFALIAIFRAPFNTTNINGMENLGSEQISQAQLGNNTKVIMTLSEKQEIANVLLLRFQELDAYFETHSFHELTQNINDRTDYFGDDILEYVYLASLLYDCYVGLTGVFRDVISEEEFEKCVNTHCDWLFSDRIRYGYTQTGAHIIVILPVESNDTSLWLHSINKVRDDIKESDILDPTSAFIDVYVEDLTGKVQEYDISIRIEGEAFSAGDDGISGFFSTKTDISDEVKECVKLYGRNIDDKSTINDRTWKLFMIDKGDYSRFLFYSVEITLDGEIIQLQPLY